MTIPVIPISMGLIGSLKCDWFAKIFYVILVQYCGHHFSASDCKPDQNETRCER